MVAIKCGGFSLIAVEYRGLSLADGNVGRVLLSRVCVCWLLVDGCWLFVVEVGWLMLVIGWWWLEVCGGCWLLVSVGRG